MKYQLVIFDSDGTLADTLPWMQDIFHELAEVHGYRRVAAHEEDRFRELHGRELLRALNLPLWKLPRVVRDVRARMAAHTHHFSLFAGIAEMLQQLHDCGIRLAIVSSNSRENVECILRADCARLIQHFDCGASIFGKGSRLRRILRKTGIAPQHTIYIGDEVRDAEAAHETGIAFGAVTWGHHSIEALRRQRPSEIFRSPSDIGVTLC